MLSVKLNAGTRSAESLDLTKPLCPSRNMRAILLVQDTTRKTVNYPHQQVAASLLYSKGTGQLSRR